MYNVILSVDCYSKGGCVVLPVIASGITQALPQLSSGKTNASAQDERVASSSTVVAPPVTENKPDSADTVSISSQVRQTINDVKKEYVKKTEASKENSSEKPSVVMPKVQFAYNMKGDLSVKYMDASNNLIYQAPSELMIRIKEEAASRLDSAVDTKV